MIKKFLSSQEINDYIDQKIYGSFLPDDITFLGSFVKKLKGGDSYLEIGTQHGKSIASAIFQSPEGVKFYTCDLEDLGEVDNKMSRQDFFTAEGLNKVCDFILGDSKDIAKNWTGGKLSMVFIDGTHTYDSGKIDIHSWYPRLKRGGFMVFHDYSDNQFTVSSAINEFVRDSGKFTDFTVAANLGMKSSMAGAVKI